jgi:ABC-type Mn2+/Zn2+ transport system permease subunit
MTEKNNDCSQETMDKIKKRSSGEWVKWVGFISGLIIFLNVVLFPNYWISNKPDTSDILFSLFLIIIPSIGSAILSLYKKYSLLLVTGLWFMLIGFIERTETYPANWSFYFVIAATILFITPFLARSFVQKEKIGTKEKQEKIQGSIIKK